MVNFLQRGNILIIHTHFILIGNVECGTKVTGTRIVGGTNAIPGAWPWQVTMDYKGHTGNHWCGAPLCPHSGLYQRLTVLVTALILISTL